MTTQTHLITNIQDRFDSYQMVLQPQSFTLRNRFRDNVANRIDTGNNELPICSHTVIDGERIDFIDSETINQMNLLIPDDQRSQLMRNILDFIKSDEIRLMLIENSTEEVKNKLRELLIRASCSEISSNQLYTLGNIILYTMSSIPEVHVLREVLEPLRNSMFTYDHNQIMQHISQISPDMDRQIDEINTTTEIEVRQRTNETNSHIARILQNRQNILMYGGGLLTTMALGYAGFPYLAPFIGPLGNIMTRSIPSNLTTTALIPSTNGNFGASVDILSWKEICEQLSKKAREFFSGCL